MFTVSRKAIATLTCLLAFQLGAAPALAQEEVPPNDDHLHLVRTERRVLVQRDVVVVPRYRHRGGLRESIITPGHVYDVFISHGPIRIGEGEFESLIQASGADPELMRRIQATRNDAFWHGALATGMWIGSIVAGGVAEAEFGPDPALVARSSNTQLVINTAGIAALVLAVGGAIYTWMWLGDSAPKGSPYFHDFSEGEAQRAIDAYNRQQGGTNLKHL